jgi:hypothetical protein
MGTAFSRLWEARPAECDHARVIKGSRRSVALVVGVLVVVAAAVAYQVLPPRQTRDVAVPADDATPEQVVTAYLDALNAHDCGTARAVMTAATWDRDKSWCEHVGALTDVDVGDHYTERPEDSGHSVPEEVANVRVTFDLDWRFPYVSGSMDEGATAWGYLLVRDSPESPWRIFDQGTG